MPKSYVSGGLGGHITEPSVKRGDNWTMTRFKVVIGTWNAKSKEEDKAFVPVVVWESEKAYFADNVEKGDYVDIPKVTSLRKADDWDDKDGNKRYGELYFEVQKYESMLIHVTKKGSGKPNQEEKSDGGKDDDLPW